VSEEEWLGFARWRARRRMWGQSRSVRSVITGIKQWLRLGWQALRGRRSLEGGLRWYIALGLLVAIGFSNVREFAVAGRSQ
jgi:hypothetical protein